MDITKKLETIKHRWEEMGEQLADPAVASDMKKFVKLNKDYKDLDVLIITFLPLEFTQVHSIANAFMSTYINILILKSS